MTDIKTSPKLLDALAAAAARSMTAAEIRAQKASFVYGSLGSKNDMTLDQVKHVIAKNEGTEPVPA